MKIETEVISVTTDECHKMWDREISKKEEIPLFKWLLLATCCLYGITSLKAVSSGFHYPFSLNDPFMIWSFGFTFLLVLVSYFVTYHPGLYIRSPLYFPFIALTHASIALTLTGMVSEIVAENIYRNKTTQPLDWGDPIWYAFCVLLVVTDFWLISGSRLEYWQTGIKYFLRGFCQTTLALFIIVFPLSIYFVSQSLKYRG